LQANDYTLKIAETPTESDYDYSTFFPSDMHQRNGPMEDAVKNNSKKGKKTRNNKSESQKLHNGGNKMLKKRNLQSLFYKIRYNMYNNPAPNLPELNPSLGNLGEPLIFRPRPKAGGAVLVPPNP
jgi:hypothetical protein